MRKQSIAKLLLDKVILIVVGVVCLIGLVELVYFLEDVLAVPLRWITFIYFSLLYVAMVTRYSIPFIKKQKRKLAGVLLLSLLQISIVGGSFLIFYFGFLPLPEKGLLIWAMLMGLVATAAVIGFSRLVGRERLKKS